MKLIREEIETTYKNQLNATLDQIVRQGSIAKKNLYAHPKFVEKMVDYIIQDFEEGRTALDAFLLIHMHWCFMMKVQNKIEKMTRRSLKKEI